MASWEEKAAARRQTLAGLLPAEWRVTIQPPNELRCVQNHESISQLLAPLELEITSTSTPDLLERLQKGEWTAEAAVVAFCKRAALAQQALNCATDLLFDE